jgi:hypothetical protein
LHTHWWKWKWMSCFTSCLIFSYDVVIVIQRFFQLALNKLEHNLNKLTQYNCNNVMITWATIYYAVDTWKDVYKTFVGKPERKRQFGTPRCRWDDQMKRDLKKTLYKDMNCIHLPQDRLLSTW